MTDKDKIVELARITDDRQQLCNGRLSAWGKRFTFSADGDIIMVEAVVKDGSKKAYRVMGQA
jgi:hypothetical protein